MIKVLFVFLAPENIAEQNNASMSRFIKLLLTERQNKFQDWNIAKEKKRKKRLNIHFLIAHFMTGFILQPDYILTKQKFRSKISLQKHAMNTHYLVKHTRFENSEKFSQFFCINLIFKIAFTFPFCVWYDFIFMFLRKTCTRTFQIKQISYEDSIDRKIKNKWNVILHQYTA